MKGSHVGAYWAYRGLGELIARVPERVAEAGGALGGDILYLLKPADRRMMRRHLARVLSTTPVGTAVAENRRDAPISPVPPGPALRKPSVSEARLIRKMCHQSFRAYGRYWVEGALLPHLPVADITERISIREGMDHLVQAMSAGRGVVMALPHVGSWEWGGAFLSAGGIPMTSVAERIEPPELYEWLREQRHALGLIIEPLDGKTSILLDTLRQGGLVGLLCDRDLVGNGIQVEFFGETTTLPAGPATLALRSGAALVAGVVYSGPGRSHTGVVSSPLDTTRRGRFREDVSRITQDIARLFENYIRHAPEQWHLFQPNWPSDDPSDSIQAGSSLE